MLWVDICSPIEDCNSAPRLQHAHCFPQDGNLVHYFMPDICEKEQAATRSRQTGLVSFRANQFDVGKWGIIQLLFESGEHFGLRIDGIDLSRRDDHLRRWKPEQTLRILEPLRLGCRKAPVVHASLI